jgi:hypothetical protein
MTKNAPSADKIRFRVTPRYVPPIKAARRLHLTLEQFELKKGELFARQFPRPDPTTGMYDLCRIDQWMDDRDGSTGHSKPRDAREVIGGRLARL